MKLTTEEKEYIVKYLDEYNGSSFNEDVNAKIAPNYEEETKDFVSSEQELMYWIDKGIEAVENEVVTYRPLLGITPL